jgi:hypothetical protein
MKKKLIELIQARSKPSTKSFPTAMRNWCVDSCSGG